MAGGGQQPLPIGPGIQWFLQDLSPAFCCRPQCTALGVGCPGDAPHACRPTHPEGGARGGWGRGWFPDHPAAWKGARAGLPEPTEVSSGNVLVAAVSRRRGVAAHYPTPPPARGQHTFDKWPLASKGSAKHGQATDSVALGVVGLGFKLCCLIPDLCACVHACRLRGPWACLRGKCGDPVFLFFVFSVRVLPHLTLVRISLGSPGWPEIRSSPGLASPRALHHTRVNS